MVRVAIVDNAPACQTILTGLCRRYEAEQGRALDVTVFDDGDAFIASYTPDWDVIIIDVDLGGIDGLGVMRRIREVDDAVEAILVSLTDEYAVGGYEINAMSYILKPPSYEVFAHDMTRCLDGRRACERRTIQVISGGRTRRMRLDEIIYVDSVKHRTILHTMLGNMQIVCSIIRFEERLIELDHAFVRANSGYLVNLAHVTAVAILHTMLGNMQIVCSIIRFEERLIELDHAFVRANSGYLVNLAHVTAVAEHEAIMSNGDRLPISRPRRAAFKQAFASYVNAGRRSGRNLAHVTAVAEHEAIMSNGDRLPISRPRRAAFKQAFASYVNAGRRSGRAGEPS